MGADSGDAVNAQTLRYGVTASRHLPERLDHFAPGIQQPPFDDGVAGPQAQQPPPPRHAQAAPKLVAGLHDLQCRLPYPGRHLSGVYIHRAVFVVLDFLGCRGAGAGQGFCYSKSSC